MRRVIAAVACIAATPAVAHHPGSRGGDALETLMLGLLATSAVGYAVGAWRLWSRAGAGRGIRAREAACFALGWLALASALASPLDALGGSLFSAHMVQHELLMVVAAPLLALSRPLEAWTWAMPVAWRAPLARAGRWRPLAAAWGTLSDPVGAWCVHALALWLWHVPALFRLALASDGVHALQHASFFASALFFWRSVFVRGSRQPDGVGLASVFTTMMHTAALGALLAFAGSAWYMDPALPARYGFTAVEDQQLGGLVMWVPGGLAYIVTGLAIVAAWLRTPVRGEAR